MKALAKEPDARFQSMEEFRKALVGEIKVTAPRRRGAPGFRRGASTMVRRCRRGLDDAVVGVVGDRRGVRDRAGAHQASWLLGGGAVAGWPSAYFVLFRKVEAPTPAPAASARRPRGRRRPAARAAAAAHEEDRDPPVRGRARPVHMCSARRTTRTWASSPSRSSSPRTPPRRARRARLRLRLPGYQRLPLTADTSTDRTFHVSLDKLPPRPSTRLQAQGGAAPR